MDKINGMIENLVQQRVNEVNRLHVEARREFDRNRYKKYRASHLEQCRTYQREFYRVNRKLKKQAATHPTPTSIPETLGKTEEKKDIESSCV